MMAAMSAPLTPLHPLKSYDDALRFIEELDVSAMKLGLGRIEKLLETLDNPQEQLPMVHIAGTNGKGSVTAMLASVLRAAGYSVGSFTSPHLIHVRERISINGNPILPDDFQYEVSTLKTHLESLDWPREEWPTYFEFLNVVAYQYFRRKGVDITVIETGLGGRLDSTNVVRHPNLTVITGIGLDHMQHLGDTLEKIAAEKAGILKSGSPLVLGSGIPNGAKQVIMDRADALDVPVFFDENDRLEIQDSSSPAEGLLIENRWTAQHYRLSLLGPYQKNNLAIVLACVQQLRQQNYEISESAVQEGLAHTYWPVRFQYFEKENLLLDGSHNGDGFASLAEGLKLYFANRPIVWLLSLRSNRDVSLLKNLVAQFNTRGVVVTKAHPEHLYHAPETLAKVFDGLPVVMADNPTDALAQLKTLGTEDNAIRVITGSLYTAGEILQCLELSQEHVR